MLFAGLVEFAGLASIPALIGFAVIALAVLIREAALPGADDASIYGERTGPLLADRMVDADHRRLCPTRRSRSPAGQPGHRLQCAAPSR